MAAIPLLCTICPKKPKFSDVSHLLTHIASKGHLSHYYKEKVRSSNDDASRRLIDTYDRWYTEWNVEELMSDRMSQKDKRRARTRPTVRATPALKIEAPVPRHARSRAGLLDPRLSEQQMIKVEHTPNPTPQPGPILRHRPFAPHMQCWPTVSRASSRTGSYTIADYETSSEYSDPSERHRYRYPVDNSCAIDDDSAETPVMDPMAVSESTKLKGIYWPGMDIFDSATPEMRRKRNQKKDSSVVQQLELNSQEVEALELVFTPQGSFKRQRRISSSVCDEEEDESPIKIESPKPLLSRQVLADMDVNALRRPHPLTRSHLPYLSRNSYEDDHKGFDFQYSHGHGDRGPKRKRAFEVFQDDEISFGQPTGFNYLTSGIHQQASPTPAPTLPSYKLFGSPLQFENKENTLPAIHQPMYDHRHPLQPAGYHYHGYAYGLEQDHSGFTYNNTLYSHEVFQQQGAEDDDQRTITAPPSPSTG